MALIPCLIPQRRGSLKNLTEGSHWLECLSLPCLFPKGEFFRTPLGVPLFGNAFSYLIRISIFTYSKSPLLIPQRRGSLKNLSEGSHLLECSHSFILLISKFDPPTTQTFRRLIVWVRCGSGVVGLGWVWVWGVFTSKIF